MKPFQNLSPIGYSFDEKLRLGPSRLDSCRPAISSPVKSAQLKYPAHYDPILTSSFSSSFRFVRTSLGSGTAPSRQPLGSGGEKNRVPRSQPALVVKQRVGLTDVEVDYSRPNKNDREIFGGLVPYGKLWRTGANAITKIKFSKAVTLGGNEIPAGEYTLFTIPTVDDWTIIISKDAKVQSAADYKQENDAARITAKPEPIPNTIETFTIGIGDVKGASATLNFLWDKTRVPVKLTTDDVEQVSKQLDAVVSAKTPLDPRTAYQAAAFYYDNTKDMNQAA